MFLTFGCDNIVTNEIPVNSQGLVIKPDRDMTFEENSQYYIDLYGADYFIDTELISSSDEEYEETEITDLEWTMIELELADEIERISNDETEYEFESESSLDNLEEQDIMNIQNLNPEELLDYINFVN